MDVGDYSPVIAMLDEATGRACDQALKQVREGLRPERV